MSRFFLHRLEGVCALLLKRMVALCFLVIATGGAGLPAHAGDALSAQPALRISDAWVRAVPPVAKNSAGYLVIENTGKQDVLLGATVSGARVTEMHEMVRRGETMAMRRRAEVVVPAAGRVDFAPGGLHLMLIDLQKPLQAGDKLDGVLRFREAGEVKVEIEVRVQ